MSLTARLEDLRDEAAAKVTSASAHLQAVFDALWAHRLESEPELATYLGEPGPTHRWSDLSLEAIDRRRADDAAALAELRRFTGDGLDDVERTSLQLAVHDLEQLVSMARFPTELLPMTTMYGPHVDVPQVVSLMPARTVGDLEDVVARLSGVAVLVDQHLALLEEGRRQGVTIPRVVAAHLPDAVRHLAAGCAAPDAPLLAPFGAPGEGVDPADLAELTAEARSIVAGSVARSFGRLADHLDATYLPACRTSTGLGELPDGQEWYAELVRRETTTSLTPGEIHAIGVDEVARIRREMDDVIAATGFEDGFAAFAGFVRDDARFYFDDAEELLSRYRDIAKRADAETPRLFGLLPRLPYGVRPVPDHEAPTAPAAFYLPGSLELGRPGWFCANTFDLAARPSYEMEATCLHEAVPGHHFQIAIAAELEGLPAFRTKSWSYTAYVEGWGLYAEGLGAEMGFYGDPYDRFGQLASELFRAIRLVVDTGMHALGWSRDRAVDYFASTSTTTLHEVNTEIDRYLSIPAQALSYKIGERTITRLRVEAAGALGESFDVRRFHDVVLGAGALPLDLLEARVRGWIAAGGR